MSVYRRREDIARGLVGWWLQPARRGWIAVLFVLLIGTAGALTERILRDEHATCLIQARGLPAGHELAATMNDIHALLTQPSRPDQPPPPAAVRAIVADLNTHLAAYGQLESHQPKSRQC